MSNQNLIFNMLSFNHPVEELTFSCFTEKAEGRIPFHKSQWSDEIKRSFPKLPQETQFLYIDFNTSESGTPISINLPKNPTIAKRYYQFLIAQYLKTKTLITKANFINDLEFWHYAKDNSSIEFFFFKKFAIRVIINRLSAFPQLLISYEGMSKVFKESISQLNIPTEAITKVIFDRKIYNYDKLPDHIKAQYNEVRPILNHSLASHLKIPFIPFKEKNKIKRFHHEINWFVKNFLLTPQFKEIIPLTSDQFMQVPQQSISNTSKDSNLLVFGQNQYHLNPFKGFSNFGPFKPSTLSKIEFILVFHQSDRSTAHKLLDWFEGKVNPKIKSLKEFIHTNFYVDINKSIVFNSLDNPFPEIKQQIQNFNRIPGSNYIAIYITPHAKEITNQNIHSIYYKIKYEFLKYSITSQVIEKDTILNPGFSYSIPNIAIAMLAKLNGIPWRLNRPVQSELIIGVGAFISKFPKHPYIASSFSFSNDGFFQAFDCSSAFSTTKLAGAIRDAVFDFIEKNKSIQRLIIHFYKRMSKKEIKPIIQVLRNLNLDIPVFIISLNKTESRDFVVFDTECPDNNLIPNSGTIINIGFNQFLLCNNTRYNSSLPSAAEGYPFPVKLTIQASDNNLLKDKATLDNLIDQAYQFSRMYWSSVTQQSLPVTVKYPEMMAKNFPHFQEKIIPDFGKTNLWFL